jgi:hypothetical protein
MIQTFFIILNLLFERKEKKLLIFYGREKKLSLASISGMKMTVLGINMFHLIMKVPLKYFFNIFIA